MPDIPSPCPACGHGDRGRTIAARGYLYATCSRCGSGWLDPLPAVGESYGESYFLHSREGGYQDYGADEPIHRRNARERLVRIAAAGAWQQIYPPTVIHLFTRTGLLGLVERTGFAEERIQRTTKLVSVGTVLGQVGSRLARSGSFLLRLARSPWIASRALRYPGDDLVTLVARCRPDSDVGEIGDAGERSSLPGSSRSDSSAGSCSRICRGSD